MGRPESRPARAIRVEGSLRLLAAAALLSWSGAVLGGLPPGLAAIMDRLSNLVMRRPAPASSNSRVSSKPSGTWFQETSLRKGCTPSGQPSGSTSRPSFTVMRVSTTSALHSSQSYPARRCMPKPWGEASFCK